MMAVIFTRPASILRRGQVSVGFGRLPARVECRNVETNPRLVCRVSCSRLRSVEASRLNYVPRLKRGLLFSDIRVSATGLNKVG